MQESISFWLLEIFLIIMKNKKRASRRWGVVRVAAERDKLAPSSCTQRLWVLVSSKQHGRFLPWQAEGAGIIEHSWDGEAREVSHLVCTFPLVCSSAPQLDGLMLFFFLRRTFLPSCINFSKLVVRRVPTSFVLAPQIWVFALNTKVKAFPLQCKVMLYPPISQQRMFLQTACFGKSKYWSPYVSIDLFPPQVIFS